MPDLDKEEYVEQVYFFRTLCERMGKAESTQDLLESVRDEVLATTKLPLAIDFLASELRHAGVFSTAMAKMPHYFAPFQTFVIGEAENELGRFDMRIALEILRREAKYRAKGATPQGVFLYQFETLCHNRLGYDEGLAAVAEDACFDAAWRDWILTVRRQVGIIDFADMVYVRSAHYAQRKSRHGTSGPDDSREAASAKPILFGEKEGRIAAANRGKDPPLLFSALQRQLGYPKVPRPATMDQTADLLPALMRRMERVETRLKLLEEEQKGGIDLARFYGPKSPPQGNEGS